jgi:hypothetical protein
MARLRSALAVFSISCTLTLSAATRINDPKTFVADVYHRLIATRPGDSSYTPPDDIYSARLAKLFRDDRRKAKGGVGCLEIFFWVNGQDYAISDLTVTSADQGADRKTVTAKFMNIDRTEEIRFDFLRNGRRWLLDESALGLRHTLDVIRGFELLPVAALITGNPEIIHAGV